jgi:hypothetical protein
VDSIPGGSWQHTSAESNEVVVFRGSFGALAEKGLTWSRRHAGTKEQYKGFAPTAIDVPFSRFSATKELGKEKSDSGVKPVGSSDVD